MFLGLLLSMDMLVSVDIRIIVLGSGVLTDGLYELKLDKVFGETLLTVNHNIGLRRSMLNENSTCLWYKRLGYIQRKVKEIVKGCDSSKFRSY